MNPRRLYRSRDRQLAGVAGGSAEYLNIDPTVVRVLWILAAIFTGGLVLLAYIVLAIITPESPYMAATGAVPGGYPGYAGYGATGSPQPGAPAGAWTSSAPPAGPAWSPDWAAAAAADTQTRQQARGRGFGAAAVFGVVLIVIGAIALADAALPGWSSAMILGPAVIIALGAGLLVASLRRQDESSQAPAAQAGEPAWPGDTGPSEPAAATSAGTATAYGGTDTQPVDPASLV